MTDQSPAMDIQALLVAGSIGWPVYVGKEPDEITGSPNCITLYDTPGVANPKFRLDEPRFQVRVRSVNYNDGWLKANAVKNLLLGRPSGLIGAPGSTWYTGIWCVVDTYFLMPDTKGRSIFVSEWRVIRETTEGTHRVAL